MRIRKNAAKFSQLSTPPSSSSSSNTLIKKTQYLNCVLNQSPWDIITFPPPPPNYSDSSISPPLHFQVDELEFGCAGNGSFSPSIEPIYSVPCSTASVKAYMESEVKLDFGEELEEETQLGFNKLEEEEKIVIKDENKEDDILLCSEINGKGWQCGRVLKKGNNVCARHMKKGVVSGGKKSPEPTPVVPARRGRGRPRTKKPEAAPAPAPAPALGGTAQDPHEFYYYSGFGPLWGKKKGLGGGRLSNSNGIDESEITSITMTKNEERKRMEDEGIEYMECDDEDEDEEDDEVGKKRVRKRIKARSLKSLM